MSNLPYEIIYRIANYCKLEDVMSMNKIWNLDYIIKRKEKIEKEYVYKTVFDTLSENECRHCLLFPIHKSFCYTRVMTPDRDTNVTVWVNPKYVDIVYKAINDVCPKATIEDIINNTKTRFY